MTQVRTHTRQTKNGRVKVEQHTRAGDRQAPQWFQPRRAWRNAKRSRWSLKDRRKAAAAAWGAAAVSEIVGFLAFKTVGALCVVLGAAFVLLGTKMWARA